MRCVSGRSALLGGFNNDSNTNALGVQSVALETFSLRPHKVVLVEKGELTWLVLVTGH